MTTTETKESSMEWKTEDFLSRDEIKANNNEYLAEALIDALRIGLSK